MRVIVKILIVILAVPIALLAFVFWLPIRMVFWLVSLPFASRSETEPHLQTESEEMEWVQQSPFPVGYHVVDVPPDFLDGSYEDPDRLFYIVHCPSSAAVHGQYALRFPQVLEGHFVWMQIPAWDSGGEYRLQSLNLAGGSVALLASFEDVSQWEAHPLPNGTLEVKVTAMYGKHQLVLGA